MEKLGKAKNESGAAPATGAPKRPVKEERAAARGKRYGKANLCGHVL